jgi:heme exporter protein B
LNEIKTLIWKEVTLEWRQKYALSGMLLYVVSTVFVCYLSFNLRRNQLTPIVWNTLFWIILLFTAVNAIAKSFSQERYGRLLYYYNLCSPAGDYYFQNHLQLVHYVVVIWIWIYILHICNGQFGSGYGPVRDLYCTGFHRFCFGSNIGRWHCIESRQQRYINGGTQFSDHFAHVIDDHKLSKNALDGLDWSVSTDEITTLLSIDLIVITLSILLFPYLWRS